MPSQKRYVPMINICEVLLKLNIEQGNVIPVPSQSHKGIRTHIKQKSGQL
jgi:hypothetical protein